MIDKRTLKAALLSISIAQPGDVKELQQEPSQPSSSSCGQVEPVVALPTENSIPIPSTTDKPPTDKPKSRRSKRPGWSWWLEDSKKLNVGVTTPCKIGEDEVTVPNVISIFLKKRVSDLASPDRRLVFELTPHSAHKDNNFSSLIGGRFECHSEDFATFFYLYLELLSTNNQKFKFEYKEIGEEQAWFDATTGQPVLRQPLLEALSSIEVIIFAPTSMPGKMELRWGMNPGYTNILRHLRKKD